MGNRNKKEYLRTYRENGIADCLPEVSEQASVDTTIHNGRIKMFDPARGFGIIFDGNGSADPTTRLFHINDVIEGEPARRAEVTFELKSDDKSGNIIAGNVRILQKNIRPQIPGCRGHVDWFDAAKRFGFIRDNENRSAFVHLEQVRPTATGHRCFLKPGAAVYFTLNEREDAKFFASDVRLAQEDSSTPDQHEFSRITRWSINQQHGVVTRSCGACKLAFRAESVVTEGLECIRIGDFVQHSTETLDGKWFATNVVLFEPNFEPPATEPVYPNGSPEAFFASIPDDPQPTPAPEPQIYNRAERKMSLRALINRKKVA